MHWRFGLKIREQFTVSAFSVTVWQTLLHILINVYWNKYGLIQTDAINDIVVYSFLAWLITESITIYSVHLPFQCNISTRITIWQKNQIRIILLNLDFKIWNGRQSKRLYLTTWGEFFFFFNLFSFNNNTNTGFSSRHRLRLQQFCLNSRYMTGNFWMQ
jgi:hypothetical protein